MAVLRIALLQTLLWARASSRATSCGQHGFTAELRCSSCDGIDEFLGAKSDIATSCRECCTADDVIKFQSAVIDVCK